MVVPADGHLTPGTRLGWSNDRADGSPFPPAGGLYPLEVALKGSQGGGWSAPSRLPGCSLPNLALVALRRAPSATICRGIEHLGGGYRCLTVGVIAKGRAIGWPVTTTSFSVIFAHEQVRR